jgi:hypothetical protein
MARQFRLAPAGGLDPNRYTSTVVLVDADGNPVEFDGAPVEVAIDDVTGLTAALAGKASTSHTQAATTVDVSADATNGISAGTLQVVLSALAARVKALEDAAA